MLIGWFGLIVFNTMVFIYGSWNSKTSKLPITFIAKEIISEKQFKKNRSRAIATPDSVALTFWTSLGNH